MKFNHKKRSQKFHEGFKAALEEVVFQMKQNTDQSVDSFIKSFEYAITLLEKKK